MPRIFCLQVGFCFLLMFSAASAEDWNRFRGANGSGVTSDAAPTEWSATKNMAWSINLPGRGVSSPIIVGDKVFVTCYSGYGIPGEDGQIEDLKRHLVCVNRSNGTVLWTATIPAELPEDPYSGAGVPSHGYASHTPTSDGERVYVFFGKSGALAFDLEGNKLWQTNLGKESGRMRWGSAASPILVNELLVVNASEESEALVGLNAKTGEEVWRAEAAGMAGTWSTPAVATANGEQEIVLAVPYEVWGFNPVNGKLKWYAPGTEDQTMSASVITDGDVIYAMGGRGGNSVAVRAGGKGDVAATNVVWEGSASGRFASPVAFDGRIFVNNGGVLTCYSAKDGERIYQERLEAGGGGNEGGGREGGFGRGGRGGGDYASPIIANGKLYITLKSGLIHVVDAGPEFKLISSNDLSADKSGFDGTPAVSNGQLFLRSHAKLYCIAE
ncbi:MAG: PQQ-like beta-propeller repeat protein [Planctomycetaceae bacterium]|nr:PQQ-like beta-propeller repeat protein [Planctomycetaceae bacterium]